jgi:hypothetical protein
MLYHASVFRLTECHLSGCLRLCTAAQNIDIALPAVRYACRLPLEAVGKAYFGTKENLVRR